MRMLPELVLRRARNLTRLWLPKLGPGQARMRRRQGKRALQALHHDAAIGSSFLPKRRPFLIFGAVVPGLCGIAILELQNHDAVGGLMAPDVRISVARGAVDEQSFRTVVLEGRREKGMPGFAGVLSDGQVAAIYVYVSARASGKVGAGRPA